MSEQQDTAESPDRDQLTEIIDRVALQDIIDRAIQALPDPRTLKLLKHMIRAADPRDLPTLAEVSLSLEEVGAILAEADPIDPEKGGAS